MKASYFLLAVVLSTLACTGAAIPEEKVEKHEGIAHKAKEAKKSHAQATKGNTSAARHEEANAPGAKATDAKKSPAQATKGNASAAKHKEANAPGAKASDAKKSHAQATEGNASAAKHKEANEPPHAQATDANTPSAEATDIDESSAKVDGGKTFDPVGLVKKLLRGAAPEAPLAPVKFCSQRALSGHWEQVATSGFPSFFFHNGGSCGHAYFETEGGKLNISASNGKTATLTRVLGSHAVSGAWNLHLGGHYPELPFWVVKTSHWSWMHPLEPYSYIVVSDPFKASLFVLARDRDEYERNHAAEVDAWLEQHHFGHHMGNRIKQTPCNVATHLPGAVNQAAAEPHLMQGAPFVADRHCRVSWSFEEPDCSAAAQKLAGAVTGITTDSGATDGQIDDGINVFMKRGSCNALLRYAAMQFTLPPSIYQLEPVLSPCFCQSLVLHPVTSPNSFVLFNFCHCTCLLQLLQWIL
ncbi:unnamed protein product [Chrysoparadoxa australica]